MNDWDRKYRLAQEYITGKLNKQTNEAARRTLLPVCHAYF